MEDFKLTGKHPEIEEVRARAAAETLHPMPDVDLARPRTFIEFTLEGKPIGPFENPAARFPSPSLCTPHTHCQPYNPWTREEAPDEIQRTSKASQMSRRKN